MSSPAAWSAPSTLAGVVRSSNLLLSSHTRHFLALSVLFLLPLSSLLIASPFPLPSRHPTLLRSSPAAPSPLFLLALALAAVLLFSSSSSAAVSHSVHHAFFGRPVHLLPALRSLPASLLRLLPLLLPPFPLLLLSLPLPLALSALALYLLIYPLPAVITVLESAWGLQPLRRTAHLIRGMMLASLCLNVSFITGIMLTLWGFRLRGIRVAGGWGEVIPVVARTVVGSAVAAVMMLYWLVTNAVLYLYCKALHGELEGEIAEEFAREYLCLPFDEQKVPHVVSVVRRN